MTYLENKDECKVGNCEMCNKKNTEVIAEGYLFMGFICEDCYKHCNGIYD